MSELAALLGEGPTISLIGRSGRNIPGDSRETGKFLMATLNMKSEVQTQGHRSAAAEIVPALRARRREVAATFAEALAYTPKWASQIQAGRSEWNQFLDLNFVVLADYLIEYFEHGDVTFKHLLVGEEKKNLHDPKLDEPAAKAQTLIVGKRERENLESLMRNSLPEAAWLALAAYIDDVHRILAAPSAKSSQRILLVGDCLFLDILPFVIGELLDVGIEVAPQYAASKNAHELHDQLRELSSKKFDLVFFSPFSYEFSPAYASLSQWRDVLSNDEKVQEVVKKSWDEVSATIGLLADMFDCPIFVHNSSGIIRDESVAKRWLKLAITSKVRVAAKREINSRLAGSLIDRNARSFKHIFLFDEDQIARNVGLLKAGATYYRTSLQHPAVLGRLLSERYVDIIIVNTLFKNKKLIITDLDNTLWRGVIGEGAVEHYHERQSVLKELKRKGIVLAIASKNDPKMVHWRESTLSEDDFVYSAISWEPKVHGVKQIQSALNLKMKDFVFVDDRADERELMKLAYPEIVCQDANDSLCWRRWKLWAEMLEDNVDMDRTLMYKQREERKAFVRDDLSSDEDKAALFASLKLKLTIRTAAGPDLKRVVELINRTNQFNLEGSRTTLKEVSDWFRSPEYLIVLGQTADRFGEMGVTCVAVARCAGADMELLPFVLSCRVFGYGIERGVLNHLKNVARKREIHTISGRYLETAQNAPCKSFLPMNGFYEREGRWVLELDGAQVENERWLEVVTLP